MPEFLEVSVELAKIVTRLDEREKADARALELASKILDAKLDAVIHRVVAAETTVNGYGVRMAMWAGLGAGVAFFVGRFFGKGP